MNSIYSSDIPKLTKADNDFKETHRKCASSKDQTIVQMGHLTDEEIDRLLDRYLKRVPRKDRWAWVRRLFNSHATQ